MATEGSSQSVRPRLCPFQTDRPSFLVLQVTEAKRRNERSISKVTFPRSLSSAPAGRRAHFQTQPALVISFHNTMSRVSFSHTPPSAVFSRVRSKVPDPNGHDQCSFLSFGTVRKGLGANPRSLGSRRWYRCPLRTLRILEPSSHIRAVFNVTLLGSGLVQLLSVTPIVKNGVLVKLPLVRVLFVFYLFTALHRHTHTHFPLP